MRAVLKTRVDGLTKAKASEDVVEIKAGVMDVRTILDEIDQYADNVIATKDELRNEEA